MCPHAAASSPRAGVECASPERRSRKACRSDSWTPTRLGESFWIRNSFSFPASPKRINAQVRYGGGLCERDNAVIDGGRIGHRYDPCCARACKMSYSRRARFQIPTKFRATLNQPLSPIDYRTFPVPFCAHALPSDLRSKPRPRFLGHKLENSPHGTVGSPFRAA